MTDAIARHGHGRGLSIDQIARLAPFGEETTRRLVQYLVATGRLVRADDAYLPAGQKNQLKGVIKEAYDAMMKELRADPLAPPTLAILAKRGKPYQHAIKYMIDEGEVHKCGADFLFLTQTWQGFVSFVKSKLSSHGQLSVADIRDKFGVTRKFAIPILEETDRMGLTARFGDVRIKGDRFEDSHPAP